MSGLNKLRGVAKAQPKAKKSETPIVDLPDGLQKFAKKWIEAKRDLIDAEGRIADAEGELIAPLTDLRIKKSRDDSKVHKSIKVNASKDETLTFVQNSKFTKMDADSCESVLQAAFGDSYPEYFKLKCSTVVREDISDEDADKLVEILQATFGDRINQIVEISSTIEPTEKLVNDMVMNPEITNLARDLQSTHGIVKMYKPSLKL